MVEYKCTCFSLRIPMAICIAIAALLVLHSYSFAGESDEQDYEYEESIEYTIDDNSKEYGLQSDINIRFKYLSESQTRISTFNIHQGSFDIVKDIYAKFNDEYISDIKQVRPEDEDIFISDYMIHKITLPAKAHINDEVTYQYHRDYQDASFLPLIYVPNYRTLTSLTITYNHPENMRVEFQTFFPADTVPMKISYPKEGVTIVRFAGLSRRKILSYFPFNSSHAIVMPKLIVGTKHINPTSPADFCKWYARMLPADSLLAKLDLSELHHILDKASTLRAKVTALYDFVKSNVRYIAEEESLGAIVPRRPDIVLNRRYGDCKDKAMLVSALAKFFGLDVRMAIVSTEPEAEFNGNIHCAMFNHAICTSMIDGERIFFDPTHRYCEFGNLPEGDIEGPAIIVDSNAAEFISSIRAPHQLTSLEVKIIGSADTPAQCQASIILRNSYFWNALYAQSSLSPKDLRNYLSTLISRSFQKIKIDSLTITGNSDSEMTLSAYADLSSFIISSPLKKYVPHIPFRLLDNDMMERGTDSQPIYLDNRSNYKLQIELDMKGLNSTTEQFKFGSSATSFLSGSLTTSQGKAMFNYEYCLPFKKYELEEKRRLLELCKQAFSAKKNMFIFQ